MAPIISTDGRKITVNRQGGATIPFKAHDTDGEQVSISDLNLRFVTDLFNVDLTTDPDDADGLLIVITKTQVNMLSNLGTTFAVINIDDATTEQPWWTGRIVAEDE